jgi:hypothetical protein
MQLPTIREIPTIIPIIGALNLFPLTAHFNYSDYWGIKFVFPSRRI